MHRRDFLKYLLLTPLASYVDYEKLLWIPGEKKIFLPLVPHISYGEIVALEWERTIPILRTLFERDDLFYRIMGSKEIK